MNCDLHCDGFVSVTWLVPLSFHHCSVFIHSPANGTSTGGSLKCKYQTDCGAHLAALGMGPGILSPLVRRSERGSNHSRPSSAEVKDEWSCTSAAHTPYWLTEGQCYVSPSAVVKCYCSVHGMAAFGIWPLQLAWSVQQIPRIVC